MAWKTVFIAVALACACSAWAGDTREVTETTLSAARQAAQAAQTAQPSLLRPSEGMPRYATMTPPPPEETPGTAPAPAPTARVAVSPAPPVSAAPPPSAPQATPRPVAAREPAAPRQSDDAQYHLGTGDKLRVTVFNEADLSGEFAIDGQGFVRLPLVGQVQAAGQTTFGLESRIAEAFVGGGFLLNPRVAVEIVGYRPFYILGEVNKPGEYAYVNAMTVPNAIALAGGYTDRAVETTIWIRHKGELKERAARADDTTAIRPGDVIRVERSAYWSVMTLLAPLISPFATTAYILK